MQGKMTHFLFIFRRFRVKEPLHSEMISVKKTVYLYRSMRPYPMYVVRL